MTTRVLGHPGSIGVPAAPGREILRVEVGSTLHGIGIGSDDTDLMGVTVEPRNAVTGLGKFEHFTWRSAPEGQRSGSGDVDLSVYGLKKFLRLACKGNPSVMVVLFAPESHLYLCDDLGRELIAMRDQIVSYQCKGRFLGYLNGQRQRAEQDRASGKGRREGREEKWASHMVRLGYQAVEILRTGTLTLPMAAEQAEECRAIKRGEVSFPDALTIAHRLEDEAAAIKATDSPLREHPDLPAIETWMHSVYLRDFWRHDQRLD